MISVLGLTQHTGSRLAEVGFLLIVFTGVWFAAAQLPQMRLSGARSLVAGIALASAGVPLVIPTHWGHFG